MVKIHRNVFGARWWSAKNLCVQRPIALLRRDHVNENLMNGLKSLIAWNGRKFLLFDTSRSHPTLLKTLVNYKTFVMLVVNPCLERVPRRMLQTNWILQASGTSLRIKIHDRICKRVSRSSKCSAINHKNDTRIRQHEMDFVLRFS